METQTEKEILARILDRRRSPIWSVALQGALTSRTSNGKCPYEAARAAIEIADAVVDTILRAEIQFEKMD